MFVAVCLAAMLALAASSCENTPDLETLRTRFCEANVVFRGRIMGGSSALSRDSSGQETAHSRFHFVIHEYLKIVHPRNREAETQVFRSYAMRSPCDIEPFSYDGDEPVIFGTAESHGVWVNPCYFHPSWSCLPEAFKQHYADPDFCTA